MLHRSFKPAKCKTSLKLAAARIKLLRNKKDIQVRQMKRDLAQLLESGQDQTARIRVEHVVREEKMMGAYDLIEIYCELVVARLQIIESQKNCPIDLKEAITGIVFASPRCADIPELLDARKHFTAKYGKEFINAAIELRPNCGVSRTLVEKLSATAPDGQTKMRILSAIAEEHNIKWDPKSFGESDSKPSDDLLNGPNSFENASKMQQQASSVQAPKVQAPPSHEQRHDPPVNSFEQNMTSAPSMQTSDSAYSDGTKSTMPTAYSPETRSSGRGGQRKEVEASFSGNFKDVPLGRENWNMEFKDATSAAQAAAEAAERASMAARAAAELSSQDRATRHYFEESRNPNVHGTRDGPTRYADSKLPSEYTAKDSENRLFDDQNSKFRNEQIDGNELGNQVDFTDSHVNNREPSQSASQRPNKASDDDQLVGDSFDKGHFQKSYSEENHVEATEGEYEVETVNDQQYGLKYQNFDYFVEKKIRKESSTVSSSSHSSTHSADNSVPHSGSQTVGKNAFEDSLEGVYKENIHSTSMRTRSHGKDSVVFDKYGLDDDDVKFDLEPKYDEDESHVYFPSPRRESPTRISPLADSLDKPSYLSVERHEESSPEASYSLQSDHRLPISFDQSDGPESESEDDREEHASGVTMDSWTGTKKQDMYFRNPEPTPRESPVRTGSTFVEKGKSSSLRSSQVYSHPDDLDTVEVTAKNDKEAELNASYKKRSSGQSPPSSRFSSVKTVEDSVHTRQSTEPSYADKLLNEESFDDGMGLKMGTLTGGFRNKGYIRPPYILNPSSESSLKKGSEDTFIATEKDTASLPITSSRLTKKVNSESSSRVVPTKQYDSDSDSDSDSMSSSNIKEEITLPTVSIKRDKYNREARRGGGSKSSSRPIAYFESDTDDSEDDVRQQTTSRKGHVGSNHSRRTKASPTSSGTGSYSKGTNVSQESGKERAFSWTSKWAETPGKPESQNAGSSEPSNSTKLADSTPLRESRFSARTENPKPSAVEPPSHRTTTSSGETPSKENSVKKASHVHPKLPDYDTLAAKLQSFRP